MNIAEPDSAAAMQNKSGFHSRHAFPQVSFRGKVKAPWIQRNKGENKAQHTNLFPKHMLTHGLGKHTYPSCVLYRWPKIDKMN